MTKIHLGCGHLYFNGWINVDVSTLVKADVFHDLNIFPWPFKSGSADEIWADQVIEHLPDTIKVVEEVHRILKPGGVFNGQVPYSGSVWAFTDPTHKAFFTERSFRYFDSSVTDAPPYSKVRFSIVKTRLVGNSNTILARMRNCIPFRGILKWFLWNMYDGVKFYLVK